MISKSTEGNPHHLPGTTCFVCKVKEGSWVGIQLVDGKWVTSYMCKECDDRALRNLKKHWDTYLFIQQKLGKPAIQKEDDD